MDTLAAVQISRRAAAFDESAQEEECPAQDQHVELEAEPSLVRQAVDQADAHMGETDQLESLDQIELHDLRC